MANIVSSFLSMARGVTDAAGKRTDEAYRSSKLKLSCVQLSNEINNRYELLGERLYDMWKSDKEDVEELVGMVGEIDECYRRLGEARQKLEELRRYTACPKCGEKNRLDSTYCNKCGKRLLATDEELDCTVSEFPEEMLEEK